MKTMTLDEYKKIIISKIHQKSDLQNELLALMVAMEEVEMIDLYKRIQDIDVELTEYESKFLQIIGVVMDNIKK